MNKLDIAKLSRSVTEQACIDKLEEVEGLVDSQIAQLEGLRDSLISYMTVTNQLIEELEASPKIIVIGKE